MKNKTDKRGQYELFDTTNGNRILSLDNSSYYAVVKGQKGDILVKASSDHENDKTVSKGQYYLVDFKDDPDFNDIPHLFLEDGKSFREWILPQKLPTSKGDKSKLIKSNNKIDAKKIENHINKS